MSEKATVTDADGERGKLLTEMPAGARLGTISIALEDGRHVVVPHEHLFDDGSDGGFRLDARFDDFEVIDATEPARAPENRPPNTGARPPLPPQAASDAPSEASANAASGTASGSDQSEDAESKHLTLAREEVSVERRKRPIGKVRVDKRVETEEVMLDEHIDFEEAEVERVPIGRVVDEPPQVRQEGDTIVIPVLAERLLKQVVLVEEIRVRRSHRTEDVSEPVTLRREKVDISHNRLDSAPDPGEPRPSR